MKSVSFEDTRKKCFVMLLAWSGVGHSWFPSVWFQKSAEDIAQDQLRNQSVRSFHKSRHRSRPYEEDTSLDSSLSFITPISRCNEIGKHWRYSSHPLLIKKRDAYSWWITVFDAHDWLPTKFPSHYTLNEEYKLTVYEFPLLTLIKLEFLL